MASNGALPQTLKFVTDIKINEFSKQYALFEKQKLEIIQSAENAPDLRSKAQILLEGITRLKGNPNDALDQEDMDLDHSATSQSTVAYGSERAVHVNIRRFLMQSQYDPSVSDHSLKDWIAELERELQYLQTRHDHAAFYNKLVTECLENYEGDGPEATKDVNDGNDSFEPVGRAEMQEQRSTWESLVFQPDSTDETALREYLDRLFSTTSLSKQALKEMREKIKAFGSELLTKEAALGVRDLKWLGKTLLGTDLLTKEKAAILKDFMQSDAVAREVIDVLNMRLATLASWSWPAEGIPVEMRRQLNGKYRVFMDEDILDALLLHYLGLKWSVAFRDAFDDFLTSRAWKSSHHYISKRERARRQYFLQKPEKTRTAASCVNDHRFEVYRSQYFMTQLPTSVQDGAPDYDGDDTEKPANTGKSALDTKHSLLHLLITESIIHNTLHGQFTAVRSDFKWFGPSLSHTTILTVLEYFGVPRAWLDFFKTFLEAPVKFVQDGPNAAVRTRRRGVPMSHTLSTCLGEAVLFCMDYAVNQHTNGAHLYRLHDDFWFWGPEATCIAAWDAMKKFTEVTGLEFNEEKTGSVRMESKPDENTRGDTYTPQELGSPDIPTQDSSTLPTGDIRWGFLKLDPQEGRFVIDQSQVDEHIAELQRQLAACKSVFSWVKAWNSYFGRFFVNNFAKPAMCFGRSHIDMAITTLNRIERRLFPASPSGVTGHLRTMIADRFGVRDLPDAFFFFPVELGGLELLNPYVTLFAMREDIKQTPAGRLRKAFVADSGAHQAAKERFEKHGPVKASAAAEALDRAADDDDGTTFMSLDEFTKHAEESSPHLLAAYKDLTRVPAEVSTSQTPALCQHQRLLGHWLAASGASSGPLADDWYAMKPYWRWIAELYQEGMVRKYGSLAAVSRELMPMGVVQTLKQGRFRWQG